VGLPDLQRPGMGIEIGDTSLTEAVVTLRKRRWVLFLAVVLGASYGAYKAYTQPKFYEATGTIQVHNGATSEYMVDLYSEYGNDSETRMNTEVEILKSDALLATVAREMNLQNNPDFSGVPPGSHRSLDDPNVHASVVGQLQGGLDVSLVPHTEMMRISYSSLNAKLSADIVNKVIDDYIQWSFQTPVESTMKVSQWLSGQLEGLKTEVE